MFNLAMCVVLAVLVLWFVGVPLYSALAIRRVAQDHPEMSLQDAADHVAARWRRR